MPRRTALLRRVAVALLLAAAATACAADTEAPEGAGSEQVIEDAGDFMLSFEPPPDDVADIHGLVEGSGIPQEIVAGLNETLALPQDITIVFSAENPDDLGPHYDPEIVTVVMPYDSLASDRDIFRAAGYDDEQALADAVLADVEFTLYHEVGHALVDTLELPVVGREEDAVDSLAAVLITQTVEGGGDVVLMAADWFGALAAEREDEYSFSDYAGQHSLDEQRFVSLVCMVYGSDPEAYAGAVDEEVLPEERAETCPDDYERAVGSWEALLGPYLKP